MSWIATQGNWSIVPNAARSTSHRRLMSPEQSSKGGVPDDEVISARRTIFVLSNSGALGQTDNRIGQPDFGMIDVTTHSLSKEKTMSCDWLDFDKLEMKKEQIWLLESEKLEQVVGAGGCDSWGILDHHSDAPSTKLDSSIFQGSCG